MSFRSTRVLALAVLLPAAALLLGARRARADDGDAKPKEEVTRHVTIVVAPEDKADGITSSAVSKDSTEGTEQSDIVIQLPDGRTLHVSPKAGAAILKQLRIPSAKAAAKPAVEPAAPAAEAWMKMLQRAMGGSPNGVTAAPEGEGAAASPVGTVLEWLMQQGMAHAAASPSESPLDAWFAGGRNVPMAGLRDALVRNGWNAPRLRAWLQRRIFSFVARALASEGGGFGGGPSAGPWGSFGRGPGAWGGFGPWAGARAWGGPPAGTSQSGVVLWNDGSGWHMSPLPSGAGAARPWTSFAPFARSDADDGGCTCPQCKQKREKSLEGLLERLPPQLRSLLEGAAASSSAAKKDTCPCQKESAKAGMKPMMKEMMKRMIQIETKPEGSKPDDSKSDK
jgi:hypothetical protein